MIINENTKIIGRFHTKASGRGLNIYNPFFEEVGLNALYVLFYDQVPKNLVDGFRLLKLDGAITAGFESDEKLPTLLDEIDEISKYVGKIGYLTRDASRVVGHYQNGLGMLNTIKSLNDLNGLRICIIGAGVVTRGLLAEIEKEGLKPEITIYNRNIEKAKLLMDKFSFVKNVYSFEEIDSAEGDAFINLSDIGGSVLNYRFNIDTIKKFKSVVDVTFETENTELIKTAKELNIRYATGWDMFANQGLVILEDIFKQKFDFKTFKKYVDKGLSEIVN